MCLYLTPSMSYMHQSRKLREAATHTIQQPASLTTTLTIDSTIKATANSITVNQGTKDCDHQEVKTK